MTEILLKIINEILDRNGKESLQTLDVQLSLRNDLGFDSLDLAVLTVKIEDQFGIDIFQNGIVDKVYEIINVVSRSE
ncbi:acyl carrier protein [Thermotalea metallivorans]|uniref:Carrier domain-containing protein n=1 Tax=Thermotalea metallivorans TaxID=520762 RepID=A0A140L4I2_9FIRM|nr:acyl carrier protein [Thermotalea metallivorans]KXG75457.1 hypothetical protein AN619_17210 [Thermotalea metallivorans]